MEDKIGYAFIPIAEYKGLIEDNINKENFIKELNEEACKRDRIRKKLEKCQNVDINKINENDIDDINKNIVEYLN